MEPMAAAWQKRGQHSSTAARRCHKRVVSTARLDHAGYSQQQPFYKCIYQPGTKDVSYLGVRTASHNEPALHCHVCGGKGSRWERVLYGLSDAEQLIGLHAVEAHSLDKPEHVVECEGVTVCLASQRWDVAIGAPDGLLIEMQGHGPSVDRSQRPTTLTIAGLK